MLGKFWREKILTNAGKILERENIDECLYTNLLDGKILANLLFWKVKLWQMTLMDWEAFTPECLNRN